MKIRKLLTIGIVLTISTGAFAFAGHIQLAYPAISEILFAPKGKSQNSWSREDAELSRQVRLKKTDEQTENVPDKIVYFVLFHHLVGLKKEAEKAAAKGESLNYFKLYEDQAELKNSQSQLLFQTAQDCMDAVTLIDKEAKEIIDIARAKVPNGQAESKNDIPEAPVELIELQRRKDETVLRFRDVLKDGLGAETFNKFNSFAQRKIGPQITTNLIRKEEK